MCFLLRFIASYSHFPSQKHYFDDDVFYLVIVTIFEYFLGEILVHISLSQKNLREFLRNAVHTFKVFLPPCLHFALCVTCYYSPSQVGIQENTKNCSLNRFLRPLPPSPVGMSFEDGVVTPRVTFPHMTKNDVRRELEHFLSEKKNR